MSRLRISVICLSIVFSACSGKKPKATPQVSTTVEMPEYPSPQAGFFAANNTDSSRTFTGSIAIFTAKPPVPALQDVIAASKARLLATAEHYIAAQKAQLPGQRAALVQMDEELKVYLSTVENTRNDDSLAAAGVDLTTWFQTRLATLGLTAEQSNAAETLFSGYCQAKIVELGISTLARDFSYSERPSAHPACEGYYREAGFFTGETGTCAANIATAASGGNYFRCLWLEGVLRTDWFKGLAKLDEIAQWVSSPREELKHGLQGFRYQDASGSDTLVALPVADLELLRGSVARMSIVSRLAFKFPYNKPLGTTFQFKPLGTDSSLRSPFMHLNYGPGSFSALDAYTINSVSGAVELSGATNLFAPLLEPLIYLGSRSETGNNGQLRSVADARFLKALLSAGQTLPNVVNHEPALAKYKKEFFSEVLSPEVQAGIALRSAQISAQKERIAASEAELTRLAERVNDVTLTAITASQAPGLIQTFLTGVDLNIVRKGTTVGIYVRIPVNAPLAAELFKGACIDVTTEMPTSCAGLFPEAALPVDTTDTSFSYDSNLGLITLSYPLAAPELLGFEAKERSTRSDGVGSDSFNELNPNRLRGLRLRFELAPNRVLDALDILTGKVFLLDAEGNKVHEGNIVTNETYVG